MQSNRPLALTEHMVWGRRWTGTHKWHKYTLSDNLIRHCPGRIYVIVGHVTCGEKLLGRASLRKGHSGGDQEKEPSRQREQQAQWRAWQAGGLETTSSQAGVQGVGRGWLGQEEAEEGDRAGPCQGYGDGVKASGLS